MAGRRRLLFIELDSSVSHTNVRLETNAVSSSCKRTLTPTTLSLSSPRFHLPFPSKRPFSLSSRRRLCVTMSSQQVIEHIVLFNVKDNTEPSKLDAMVNGLNSLSSLPHVLHLSMGPIFRNLSNSFKFSHMLHSRYNSKEELKGYSDHESHLKVVRENVLPICDDIMAVDWVSKGLNGEIKVKPSSAIRVSFLKVKENLGAEEKAEIFKVFGEFKEGGFDSIDQISYGENFSPARAKGFSIASLAVFPGLSELDALSSNEELMNKKKEKVRDFLEGVIVVDFVVPQVSESASL